MIELIQKFGLMMKISMPQMLIISAFIHNQHEESKGKDLRDNSAPGDNFPHVMLGR